MKKMKNNYMLIVILLLIFSNFDIVYSGDSKSFDDLDCDYILSKVNDIEFLENYSVSVYVFVSYNRADNKSKIIHKTFIEDSDYFKKLNKSLDLIYAHSKSWKSDIDYKFQYYYYRSEFAYNYSKSEGLKWYKKLLYLAFKLEDLKKVKDFKITTTEFQIAHYFSARKLYELEEKKKVGNLNTSDLKYWKEKLYSDTALTNDPDINVKF